MGLGENSETFYWKPHIALHLIFIGREAVQDLIMCLEVFPGLDICVINFFQLYSYSSCPVFIIIFFKHITALLILVKIWTNPNVQQQVNG